MSHSSTVTLALSKGRIFEETLPLLAAAGIEVLEDPEKSRKLILPTSRPDVRVVLVRASDVPTYVQYGGADLGVTGLDVLLEGGAQFVGPEFQRRHAGHVEPVEARRVLEHRRVAALLHVGQDPGHHRLDRRVRFRGPMQTRLEGGFEIGRGGGQAQRSGGQGHGVRIAEWPTRRRRGCGGSGPA